MITDAFFTTAFYLLGFFVSLFPVSNGFPSEVVSAFSFLGGYVKMLDPLVPIATLSTVIGIQLTFELLILSYKMLTWLMSKVPFFGR